MLSKNLIGELMKPYPNIWAAWIRNCVFAILLVSAGLSVNIKGNLYLILLFVVVPQTLEVVSMALVSYGVLSMPIEVCFALAFTIGTIGGVILIPGSLAYFH